MRARLLAIPLWIAACGSPSEDHELPKPPADSELKLVGVSGPRTSAMSCTGTLAGASYGVTVDGIAVKLVAPPGPHGMIAGKPVAPGASVTIDPLALAAEIHDAETFDIPVTITLP